MIKFSVIIATRKISDFLKESFEYLQQINYYDYEIIIITDDPVQKPANLNDKFIFIDSKGVGNPSIKRNLGAHISTGEVLVFLDDDAYPTANWLLEAEKLFKDSDLYALGGPAITPKNATFLEKISGNILESWMASGGTTYRHIPLAAREINDYPTVNLFVRKSAFDSVGGFSIEFWPGEDTKLCLDLIDKFGKNFRYDPNPIVYHHRRNVFAPHLKQISRYGKHRGQFARIFPKNSRLPSYFIPSIFVLGLVLGPFVINIFPPLASLYKLTIFTYTVLLVREASRQETALTGLYVALGILLTHLVYGTNFIVGFIQRPKLKLKAVDAVTGNYIEG